MAGHVKFLGILHIVFGACGALAALALLALFGGLAGLVAMASGDAPLVAVPILGGIGILVFGFFAAISFPGLIAGIGLLGYRNWARILTLVLSALQLLNFPFGTILGIYGLWVLLSGGAEALFRRPRAA